MRTRNHIRILATAATIAAIASPAAQASAIGEGGGGAPLASHQTAVVAPSPDPGVSGWEVIALSAGAAVAGVAAGAVGSRQISRRASAHARASHGA
jgi:hypothetical protein